MSEWRCHAVFVAEGDLLDRTLFEPAWTVGFNSRFKSPSKSNDKIDRKAYDTGFEVKAWVAKNASARMIVFDSGEVICEDETDATLLYMAFR